MRVVHWHSETAQLRRPSSSMRERLEEPIKRGTGGVSKWSDPTPAVSKRLSLGAFSILSRFMRNARLTLNAVHEMRELGVALVCKDEPIDTRQRGISDMFLAILANPG